MCISDVIVPAFQGRRSIYIITHIIALYWAPSDNFDLFISKLDTVLKKVYTPSLECIVCGDINIDYLTDNDTKSQIDALLKSYNLTSVVNFPTCIQKTSATIIDNIFIDTTKMKYSISPVINGLSDHDAQLIAIHTHNLRSYAKKYMLIRQINDHTINDFLTKLSCESWDGVFSTTEVNKMFNSFLDTYLKIFYSSFPLKRAHINKKTKKLDYLRNPNFL